MDIPSLHQQFLQHHTVCTDTRKITPNCIFFALKGENFNGNLFANEALEKGASLAIIDDKKYKTNESTFLCDNVLHTLQKLANYHRHHLKIPIISVTGSNGKTTTKELIHAVLSEKYNCVATKGNLNNHIGVPLTLLGMDSNTEIGLVEMGANHLGEIENLSNIATPDYGYITNFGKAHLEGFGSLEGVIQGKSELYQNLKKNKKKVFVNGEDSKQLELTKSMDRILFNSPEADIQVKLKEASEKLKVSFEGLEIQTQLIGAYNFSNIAAAIAIGYHFDVSPEKIKKGIEHYIPQMNRSQIIEKSGHKIILDAYNANPTSMMAALTNFKNSESDNKMVILGDMFELGRDAEKEHQSIIDFIEKNPFSKAFMIGENFFKTEITSSNLIKFSSFEDFRKYLKTHPIDPGFILIKGSRGMALERVLEIL